MFHGKKKFLRIALLALTITGASSLVFGTWPTIDVPNLTVNTLRRIEDINKTNQESSQANQEQKKQSAATDWQQQVGPPVQGQDKNLFSPAPIGSAQNGIINAQVAANNSFAQTNPNNAPDDPYTLYLASTDQWRNQIEVLRAKLNQLIVMEDASANDYVTWIGIEAEMRILGIQIATAVATENEASALARQKLLLQITDKRTEQAETKRDQALMKDTAP